MRGCKVGHKFGGRLRPLRFKWDKGSLAESPTARQTDQKRSWSELQQAVANTAQHLLPVANTWNN